MAKRRTGRPEAQGSILRGERQGSPQLLFMVGGRVPAQKQNEAKKWKRITSICRHGSKHVCDHDAEQSRRFLRANVAEAQTCQKPPTWTEHLSIFLKPPLPSCCLTAGLQSCAPNCYYFFFFSKSPPQNRGVTVVFFFFLSRLLCQAALSLGALCAQQSSVAASQLGALQ